MGRSHTYSSLIQPSRLNQSENRLLRFPNPVRQCAHGVLAIAAACTFVAADTFSKPMARAASSDLPRPATDSSDGQSPLAEPDLLAQVTYPTLSAGSTGASVSRLQATLKLMGFYQGAVDGVYAQATQEAVSRFQTAAGIAADGITGPSTWAQLLPSPDAVTAISEQAGAPGETSNPPPVSEATDPLPASEPATPPSASGPSGPATPPANVAPPVLSLHAEGSAVSQLQRELQTLGYYSGTIDGVFGQQTQAAVSRFQTDKQLTVDGIVGASTWEALTRALAQSAR